ncbi:MAG TPA: hypothetical protein VMW32_06885 [Bacteroidales bacterium]|nr:hypothetical protein [Bacteroidales bacterium]HUV00667.1 hypothetical protein [Bacteroidales bacterium]
MKPFMSIVLILIFIPFISCKKNPYRINLKGIEYEVAISRLEKELFDGDPGTLSERKNELIEEFGEFINLFGYVINIGDIEDEQWANHLVSFVTDKTNYEVYNSVIARYPDLSNIEQDLSQAMRHFRYYFPEAEIPAFYSFISGFNNSIVIGDSILAIGLDRYLGADSKYYPMLGIFNYMAKRMVPEKIISDCMYALANTTWPVEENQEEDNLLRSMLYEGKLIYFTRCMLPEEADSVLFGFTADQMRFCKNNESHMWEYLIEHDLLFNSDPLLIRKLTGDAPFTSYFSNESPGKAAVWIAFRLIESFMKYNPDISLEGLMVINDYQKILEGARYSP